MSAQPSASAPLVLLIDDIEDNREVYAQFLRHEGLRVAVAADGVEGLTMAARLAPSVIVLDLGLPLVDGWEVARRLKESDLTRNIPVIALTGHVTKEARERAFTAGVDDFIAKPCLPADLVAAIRRRMK
ncbi:MAG: response regulator [Acidobacteria bacterium]|nr:MAG: response regulator [Acidobacteriota bacterium]